MKTISVPISEARTGLRRLIKQAKSGKVRVLVTDRGEPQAQILPWLEPGTPWRVDRPDDPERYGDLQSPVMEEWK